MTQRYILNKAKFASQTFADEVIVLDATNGTYYTLTGNAPDVWESLIAGAPLDQIAEALAGPTGATPDRVTSDLGRFANDLATEAVLLPAPSDQEAASVQGLNDCSVYEGFVWDKHADLDELLVLDPIHEVNPEKGWPHTG